MFVDARELEPDAVVDADVCIVGAGPAGIAVAREFSERRFNIAVLESGGLEFEEGLQPLGQAGEISRTARTVPLRPKTLRTRRQFGGNANAWCVATDAAGCGVRLARFRASEFERRDWIANSGWPISLDDLAPYYDRAEAAFQIGPGGFDSAAWEQPGAAPLPVPGGDLLTSVFRFGRGNVFSKTYRQEFETSPNIRVYHHATAVEVETDEAASRATGVRAASNPGRHFRVRAPYVVLAAGAMTCTQLLLQSDRVQPEGLGNRHDVVGRYFMDHPSIQGGHFFPASRDLFEKMRFYDLRDVRGVPVMGYFILSEAALQREGLLPLSMLMWPRRARDVARRPLSARQALGIRATKRLRASIGRREAPSLSDARQAILGLDGLAVNALNRPSSDLSHVGRGGWSKTIKATHDFAAFELLHGVEQPPRRDNRVYLSDTRDALGCRKVAVDWRWHDEDLENSLRGQDLYANALELAGLGEIRVERPEGRPRMRSLSASHYLGTTRMHDDPQQGVLNAQCEVHGVRDLFVASSSSFTTGGLTNPTLTILALAVRVADEIKQRVGGMVESSMTAMGTGGPVRETAVQIMSSLI